MCSSMCMHLSAHAPFACTRMCAWGSFDASLSGLARFALFVFNDASREADSRRVERTAFDVSDYDITDVQPRRAEEWGSVLSVFFFFFHFPVAYYSERKREGETETHTQREEERLNIWPKPECDFVFTQNVLPIDVFAFVAIVWHGPKDTGTKTTFFFFLKNSVLTSSREINCICLHMLYGNASTANTFNQSLAINIDLEGNAD